MTAVRGLLAVVICVAIAALATASSAAAETLAPGFTDDTVFTGLSHPTAVRFAPSDPRIFVAEQPGVVKEFDSVSDTTATTVADLRTEVDYYWDRGLLGLAVDPDFPDHPYLYLLYAYDAPIGGTAPTWNDACPTPPGPTTDGCVVSGRLVRITLDPSTNVMVPGSEQVLINEWCQQFPSHSVGDLAFGPDGKLYVSGGEGADFNSPDWGQHGGTLGTPPVIAANPCGDPMGSSPTTHEGGAFRAQSFRITDGPARLSGALLRVDPATGAGLSTNPAGSSSDANKRRIVAYGLRNPFRFTLRPGTSDAWIGNVGWGSYEAVDRVPDPTAGPTNFGWPCYEGPNVLAGFQVLGMSLCTSLYAMPASNPQHWTPPYYSYAHADTLPGGSACPPGSSSITALDFYENGSYPASYRGALFFGDHSRNCIWAMQKGTGTLPDPGHVVSIATGAGNPVDMQTGPGGDIYYADLDEGTLHRLRYLAPHASAAADVTYGHAPLTVHFDGSDSGDADSTAVLSYHWDFGDGTSSSAMSPTHVYTTEAHRTARLTVSDQRGASDSDTVDIEAGDTPPVAHIDSPSASTTWAVGDTIGFGASATDTEETLPASAYTWQVILHHCYTPTNCHTHHVEDATGPSGSLTAPDHSYPSYLELQLTVTDSHGLTDTKSVDLQPRTSTLTLTSAPAGEQLGFDDEAGPAPLTHTVIVGSRHTISAPPASFRSWSDGGTQVHDIVAGAGDATVQANFDDGSIAALLGGPSNPILALTGVAPAPKPSVSRFSIAPSRFRLRSRGAAAKMRFVLSAPARVKVTFARVGARKARSKTLGLPGHAGLNSAAIGSKLLSPGRYRVTIRATTGELASAPATTLITVLARH